MQEARARGPVRRIFDEFERRTASLLDDDAPLVRYTAPKARSRGQVADVMLYDQQVINDVLYSAMLGTGAAL